MEGELGNTGQHRPTTKKRADSRQKGAGGGENPACILRIGRKVGKGAGGVFEEIDVSD